MAPICLHFEKTVKASQTNSITFPGRLIKQRNCALFNFCSLAYFDENFESEIEEKQIQHF